MRNTLKGPVVSLTGAVLVASLLGACVSSSGDTPGTNPTAGGGSTTAAGAPDYKNGLIVPDAAGTPVKGGTITVACYGEIRSMDLTKSIPHGALCGDADYAVYDALGHYDAVADKVNPGLAESITPNAAFTEWTIKLRSGVSFSDGTPVTAAAVAGSMGYYMKARGFRSDIVGPILAAMAPVDASTLKITLKSPLASMDTLLCGPMGMVMAPASYADPANFKPIGAGAFTFESYKPGESLSVKANPNYYGGAPNLDGIKFTFLATDDARKNALAGGGADVAYVRNSEIVSGLVKAKNPGMVYLTGQSNVGQISVRPGSPGANENVRKAIIAAIDPNVINQRAYNNTAVAGKGMYAPGSFWYTGDSDPKYDPAAAKDFVAKAKAAGWNGKIQWSSLSDAVSKTQAVTIKALLDAVGFDTEIVYATSSADLTKAVFVDKTFQVANGASSSPEENPFVALYSFYSSKSYTNPTGYSNPQVDALLEQLAATGDRAKEKEIVASIQKLLNADQPVATWANNPVLVAWTPKMHGIIPSTDTILDYSKAYKAS